MISHHQSSHLPPKVDSTSTTHTSEFKATALTSLRGISACVVVLTHAYDQSKLRGDPVSISLPFVVSGQMSVCFFFVLSAFLLTYKAYNEILPTNAHTLPIHKLRQNLPHPTLALPTTGSIATYVLRRIFRIFPAFLVAAMFTSSFSPFKWFNTIIMKYQYAGHFYTIPIELVFYMMLPILQLLVVFALYAENHLAIIGKRLPRHSLHAFVLVVISLVAINMQMVHLDFPNYIQPVLPLPYPPLRAFPPDYLMFPPYFWWGFLAGAGFHFFRKTRWAQNAAAGRLSRIPRYSLQVLITVLLALIASSNYFTCLNLFGKRYLMSTLTFGYTCMIYAVLILVLALTDKTTWLGSMLSGSYCEWMGRISYSTYLIHFIAVVFVFNHTQIRNLEGPILMILLAHLGGWLLNTIIEEPGVRLGNRIIRKYIGRATLRSPSYLAMTNIANDDKELVAKNNSDISSDTK